MMSIGHSSLLSSHLQPRRPLSEHRQMRLTVASAALFSLTRRISIRPVAAASLSCSYGVGVWSVLTLCPLPPREFSSSSSSSPLTAVTGAPVGIGVVVVVGVSSYGRHSGAFGKAVHSGTQSGVDFMKDPLADKHSCALICSAMAMGVADRIARSWLSPGEAVGQSPMSTHPARVDATATVTNTA